MSLQATCQGAQLGSSRGIITMRIATIIGPSHGEVLDRPNPIAAGAFAVVRVDVAPMCTEYKAYTAGRPTEVLGHEAAGTIEAVGRPGPLRAGTRVVVTPLFGCGRCALCRRGEVIYCRQQDDPLAETGSVTGRGTYAQYLLKQDWLLLPIPEDLSTEHAAMACCGLGPTFGAMQRLAVSAFDTLLITGLGPVGLGGVINGVARGVRVVGVEGHPYRRDLALALGAEAVLDPADPGTPARIIAMTGGEGADAAIDCSGAPGAMRMLVDGLRRRGRLAFVGEGGELTLDVSRDMLRKGLTLHGSWHYSIADAPELFEVIRRSAGKIDRLITHRFPLERVRDAWELQTTGACGKVLLDPWAPQPAAAD